MNDCAKPCARWRIGSFKDCRSLDALGGEHLLEAIFAETPHLRALRRVEGRVLANQLHDMT